MEEITENLTRNIDSISTDGFVEILLQKYPKFLGHLRKMVMIHPTKYNLIYQHVLKIIEKQEISLQSELEMYFTQTGENIYECIDSSCLNVINTDMIEFICKNYVSLISSIVVKCLHVKNVGLYALIHRSDGMNFVFQFPSLV